MFLFHSYHTLLLIINYSIIVFADVKWAISKQSKNKPPLKKGGFYVLIKKRLERQE